jgi:hypothetical protein
MRGLAELALNRSTSDKISKSLAANIVQVLKSSVI